MPRFHYFAKESKSHTINSHKIKYTAGSALGDSACKPLWPVAAISNLERSTVIFIFQRHHNTARHRAVHFRIVTLKLDHVLQQHKGFVDMCLDEMLACDDSESGGGELVNACSCSSFSKYSQRCAEKGLELEWRSLEFCCQLRVVFWFGMKLAWFW